MDTSSISQAANLLRLLNDSFNIRFLKAFYEAGIVLTQNIHTHSSFSQGTYGLIGDTDYKQMII